MSTVRKIVRITGILLSIPALYFICSLLLTYITINEKNDLAEKKHSVYLSTNGIHLEIIIPKTELEPSILDGLIYNEQEQFFSFGWGDKTYYTKTSTWSDFSIINKCKAAFFNTPALLHVIRYTTMQNDWVEIKITSTQLQKINSYIHHTFQFDSEDKKIILPGLGYYKNDDFYEATGNYNCFNTCNTWINTGFKQSNIKACLWTPFDFRLISIHKNDIKKTGVAK